MGSSDSQFDERALPGGGSTNAPSTATTLWLIPVRPSPAHVSITVAALQAQGIDFTYVSTDVVRDRLREGSPDVGLIHGGTVSPTLIDVQRWLRDFSVPTLILVENLTDDYEATLLDRGADDVVRIPASQRKLASRVDALIRTHLGPRRRALLGRVHVNEALEVWHDTRTVLALGQVLEVTKSEFELLAALAEGSGAVLTREQLANALGHETLSARALESHVSRIRAKLAAAGVSNIVDTVRGVGYRLNDGWH